MSLAPYIFPTVSGALLLGAAITFVRQYLRYASWTSTHGTVVGYRVRQTKREGSRRTLYHPQIQFESNGRRWIHESPIGTGDRRFEEGARVAILFDPADPESASLNSIREKYFLPMFFGAMGFGFALVSAWLWNHPAASS